MPLSARYWPLIIVSPRRLRLADAAERLSSVIDAFIPQRVTPLSFHATLMPPFYCQVDARH